MIKFRLLSMLLTPLALISLLLLSACGDSTPQVAPQKESAAKKRVEKVQLMPESSNESLRRQIFDESGDQVESQILYRDGEKAVTKYRSGGAKNEYLRYGKDGKLRIRMVFANDGQTVQQGIERREDDTLKWELLRNKDGSGRRITYWYDGKRVFSEEIFLPDGSTETAFYHKNGKLWSKLWQRLDKSSRQEFFKIDGGKAHVIERFNDGAEQLSYFDDQGKLYLRQSRVLRPSSWGNSQNLELSTIEEIDPSTGEIRRRITLENNGWAVAQTETFTPDGGRILRVWRSDGSYHREEVYDASGKRVRVKDFANQKPTEYVDRNKFSRPYGVDPQQNWDLQERYPYYRSED